MKKLVVKISGLFLLFVFHSGVCVAEALPSGYVGIGFGSTKFDDVDTSFLEQDCVGIISFGGTCSVSSDDSDTGLKIFGGMQVNPNFALELSYVDLGEASATETASLFGISFVEEDTAEATGFAIAAVGLWPVHDRIDLFGKVGLFMWDVDAELEIFIDGALDSRFSDSESGTDPFFGIGANFAVTDNFTIRAEWERYTSVGDEIDGYDVESDIDYIGASAIFSFR